MRSSPNTKQPIVLPFLGCMGDPHSVPGVGDNDLMATNPGAISLPPRYSDKAILAARPPKQPVDPWRPYAYLVEAEHSAQGRIEDVATVFLTNKECPFRCLMCDLWAHTTDTTVPPGAIPAQIDYALANLPPARHIKLYNSGNFFDTSAIPPGDYAAIAHRVNAFKTVIVENHPKLCTEACLDFRDLLVGTLEVALGLETAHPVVLDRLNKRMTLDDYTRAVTFLRRHAIDVRSFILLKPPYLTEEEGLDWAIRSLKVAFDAGVQCCAIVPTRGGNGIMEHLKNEGHFAPPSLSSLEEVLEAGLALKQGRVFVDLWDVENLYTCPDCGPVRGERLRQMNFTQRYLPPVSCTCSS